MGSHVADAPIPENEPCIWLDRHIIDDVYTILMPTAMFEVLAEPSRRRVLDLLRVQEQTVGELVSELGMSQPAVSKQLRVLRDAGLVVARVDAQRRIYSLRPEPLAEVDVWLEPYRKFWRGKLGALQRHLASDNEPQPESEL